MRCAWSGVVGEGHGHTGEHVLVGLARQQVAVFQSRASEVGQQGVPRPVDLDLAHELELRPGGARGADALLDRAFADHVSSCLTQCHIRSPPRVLAPRASRPLRLYIVGKSPLNPTIWGHKVERPSTGADHWSQVFFVNEGLTGRVGNTCFQRLDQGSRRRRSRDCDQVKAQVRRREARRLQPRVRAITTPATTNFINSVKALARL